MVPSAPDDAAVPRGRRNARPSKTGHPVFSRFYTRVGPAMERAGAADHRRVLLAGLSGSVIDVGAGTGPNLEHLPAEVQKVVAVEPDPYLRRIARGNAGGARMPVDVVDGTAEHLPAEDGTFDAAVTFLVLCSVTDPGRALDELHRVIRPGGQLRFFEHVRAEGKALRRVQRVADATVWPLLNGGCHASRDTARAIEDAGFELGELERVTFPPTRLPLPTSPHIRGTAVRR